MQKERLLLSVTTCHFVSLRLHEEMCLVVTLLFSTSPLDHGAYGVPGLNCTLYVWQKGVNSPLMYSFPLSVTKISGIPY